MAEGMPADAILTSVLDRSGYLAVLHGSTDPQDETRLENLKGLITVAREFVTGVATLTVPEEELDELGLPRRGPGRCARPRGRPGGGGGRTGCVVGRVLGASRTRRGLRPDTARSGRQIPVSSP